MYTMYEWEEGWKAEAITDALLCNKSVSPCRADIKPAHPHKLISQIAENINLYLVNQAASSDVTEALWNSTES